jgi:hypothetical protein
MLDDSDDAPSGHRPAIPEAQAYGLVAARFGDDATFLAVRHEDDRVVRMAMFTQ